MGERFGRRKRRLRRLRLDTHHTADCARLIIMMSPRRPGLRFKQVIIITVVKLSLNPAQA